MPQALPPRATALLLALAAGLMLFRLGTVPLLGPDEPRYARVAVEMQRAGEWVTPTLQAEPWPEKPPLYYWLAGVSFRLFGENEGAARLPSVLAALVFAGSTALFGARLYGRSVGLHAGFALATSVLAFAFGRAASMDMLLAACVTVAIGLFGLRLFGIAGRLAVAAAFAAMGLATLAKGPLGLLLPALVVLGFALATRDLRPLRLALDPVGLLAFLAVAGPWHAAILADQGRSFVDVFLLNHNVARFTSTVHNHPGPFFDYLPFPLDGLCLYLLVLLAGLFPWSGLVLLAFTGLRPRASRVDLFVLLWLGLPLVFFSLAGSKLPGYILPCLPPLALLVGRVAVRLTADEAAQPSSGARRLVALVGVVLGALVAAGPFVLAWLGDPAWASVLPAGLWAALIGLGVSRRLGPDPAGALRLLRVGGAGFLLLLALAAPPLLARRESGRAFFLPAQGREVLAFGAWRTAWMAGYFYNDGKVREVRELREVTEAARAGPALVLCGPAERRQLEAITELRALVLAEGARDNALLRVEQR